MNPKSGFVSPQFHLVFDDNVETVPHLCSGTVPENWAQLVPTSKENSIEEFYDVIKNWFKGGLYPSSEPRAASNHKTSPLATSQPNSGPTSYCGLSYPVSLDNGLVSRTL